MSTVPATPSPFNDRPQLRVAAAVAESIAADDLGGDYVARPGGHPDEASALFDDAADHLTADDVSVGLAEWDDDRAVQQADEHAADDLRASIRAARARFGASVRIKASRWVEVDTAAGDGFSVAYSLQVTNDHSDDPAVFTKILMGVGNSPAAALDDLTAQVDAAHLAPAFSGYRVRDGVALILGGFDRSKAEALDLARRVALDASYLDVLTRFNVSGIVDERPDATRRAA